MTKSSFSAQPGAVSADRVTAPRCACSDPLVTSNYLIALPALTYLLKGFVLQAGVVALSAVASVLYHRAREDQRWLPLDQGLAILAFVSTVLPIVPLVSAAIWPFLVTLVGAAFFCKGQQALDYELWHARWHLFIFFGQLLLSSSAPSWQYGTLHLNM